MVCNGCREGGPPAAFDARGGRPEGKFVGGQVKRGAGAVHRYTLSGGAGESAVTPVHEAMSPEGLVVLFQYAFETLPSPSPPDRHHPRNHATGRVAEHAIREEGVALRYLGDSTESGRTTCS